MTTSRDALRRAGRMSGTLPVAAMAAGLALPPLADALFAVLPGVFAATVFCGLMAMEAGGGRATLHADGRAALRLLLLTAALAPAPTWLAGVLLGAGPEEAAWMALVMAAPVSTVAVANAVGLGLPSRYLGLLVVAGTLAAPLTMPLVAAVFASGTPIAPLEMAQRAAVIVLIPAAGAFALRRVGAVRDGAVLARADWRGIAVLSLAALAGARMHGVAGQVMADPIAAGWAALLAWAGCGMGVAAALLAPGPAGWRGAALAGACRGGALAWTLLAPVLPPAGHLFMAMTVLPIYGVPLLVALADRWQRRGAVTVPRACPAPAPCRPGL